MGDHEQTISALINSGVRWIFYVAMALGFAHFYGGGPRSFWLALGAILVLQFLFWLISKIGGRIAWKYYLRPRAVERFLADLQAQEFPPPDHPISFANYVGELIEANPITPPYVKAAHIQSWFQTYLNHEPSFAGMRMYGVSEDAFERYVKSFEPKRPFAEHPASDTA
jgi:hypothetical protein